MNRRNVLKGVLAAPLALTCGQVGAQIALDEHVVKQSLMARSMASRIKQLMQAEYIELDYTEDLEIGDVLVFSKENTTQWQGRVVSIVENRGLQYEPLS